VFSALDTGLAYLKWARIMSLHAAFKRRRVIRKVLSVALSALILWFLIRKLNNANSHPVGHAVFAFFLFALVVAGNILWQANDPDPDPEATKREMAQAEQQRRIQREQQAAKRQQEAIELAERKAAEKAQREADSKALEELALRAEPFITAVTQIEKQLEMSSAEQQREFRTAALILLRETDPVLADSIGFGWGIPVALIVQAEAMKLEAEQQLRIFKAKEVLLQGSLMQSFFTPTNKRS
jgi:hypothetical protein